MTVADVVNEICTETDNQFSADDFTPIPCSDPNCFSLGVAIRTPAGLMPIGALPSMSEAMGMSLPEMRKLLSASTELVRAGTIQYGLLLFRAGGK